MAQRVRAAWASIFYTKEYYVNMATESWNLFTGTRSDYGAANAAAKLADENAKGIVMAALIVSGNSNKALDTAIKLPDMHARSKAAALITLIPRIETGSMPF